MKKILTFIIFSFLAISCVGMAYAQESGSSGIRKWVSDKANGVKRISEKKTITLTPGEKNKNSERKGSKSQEAKPVKAAATGNAAQGEKDECPTGLPGVEVKVYKRKNGISVIAWGTNPLATALLRQTAESYLPPKNTPHIIKNIRYSDNIITTVKKCFGGDISDAIIEWDSGNRITGTITGNDEETATQIYLASDGWKAASRVAAK